MATLHGRKLTEKQHSALKKKWADDDKKFWVKHCRSEILRLKKQVKDWEKRAA